MRFDPRVVPKFTPSPMKCQICGRTDVAITLYDGTIYACDSCIKLFEEISEQADLIGSLGGF